MNRDAAVNFKRIETQTTFRLPQAIGAKAQKARHLKALAQIGIGGGPHGPSPATPSKITTPPSLYSEGVLAGQNTRAS
jgi:hypothetical protein